MYRRGEPEFRMSGVLEKYHRKEFKDMSDRGTRRDLFRKAQITQRNRERMWAVSKVGSSMLVWVFIFRKEE